MIRCLTPQENETLSLLTDTQKSFIAAEEMRAARDGNLTFKWDALVREGEDNSFPNPVTFRWEGAAGAEVTFWPENAPEKARTVTAKTGECTAMAYNLLPGTEYVWSVDGGNAAHFTTAEEYPRWIYAEGATNIRDFGGWTGLDGRKIRYETLYRGSEMDSHCPTTEEGRKVIAEELGIRTDLDLRGEVVGILDSGILEPYGVDWKLIPLVPYDEILDEARFDSYRRVFDLLSDPASYPLYFHCWGGADRAGTLAFMISAILGVELSDLILDYELTSLSIWGLRTRNYEPFANLVRTLLTMGDGCIRKGAEAFLMKAGVPREQIEAIRSILLEA